MVAIRRALAIASWRRRHGDRTGHRPARDPSCYLFGDAGSSLPARGAQMTPPAAALGDALRSGAAVPDAEFDRLFPDELRDRSYLHWTPVEVAVRAAELLAPSPRGIRVLDVGAGVGKLCLIG